jgi:hypothetical protein
VSEPRNHGPSVRLQPDNPHRDVHHPLAGRRIARPLHRAIKLTLAGPSACPRPRHQRFANHSSCQAGSAIPASHEHSITPETVMCPGNIIVQTGPFFCCHHALNRYLAARYKMRCPYMRISVIAPVFETCICVANPWPAQRRSVVIRNSGPFQTTKINLRLAFTGPYRQSRSLGICTYGVVPCRGSNSPCSRS